MSIPGLGCGQFAGPFYGQLGALLDEALAQVLESLASELPHIELVHYDPYSQGEIATRRFDALKFVTRPLQKGVDARPQLRPPQEFALVEGDNAYRLYSLVAWDHVSWPGNDFYVGARSTDDGVKAAATSTMYEMTGFEGWYSPRGCGYRPMGPYRTWEEVVLQNGLRLKS